jgi:hypothetical protein
MQGHFIEWRWTIYGSACIALQLLSGNLGADLKNLIHMITVHGGIEKVCPWSQGRNSIVKQSDASSRVVEVIPSNTLE